MRAEGLARTGKALTPTRQRGGVAKPAPRSAPKKAPRKASKPVGKAPKPARKAAKAKRRPRVKRAPPPMVYEDPQVPHPPVKPHLPAAMPAPAPRRPGVFEPTEVLAARPGAKPPATRRWLAKPDVRLRCPNCGHGNDRAATTCEECRALL